MARVCFSVLLFICYLLTCCVEGAKKLSADVWVGSALANRHDIPQSAVELLDLDPGHDLELVDTFNTVSRTLKIKYQQTYNDVPILGATIVLEQTEDGQFTSNAHGNFIKETERDITESKFPKGINGKLHPGMNEITEADAFDISTKAFGVQTNDVSQKSINKIVYLDDDDKAHLAYELTFQVTANNVLSVPAYIIDMYSGHVLDTWPTLNSVVSPVSTPGGTIKTGKYIYGKNGRPPLMVTDVGNGTCQLINDDFVVFNFNAKRIVPAGAYSFPCSEGIHDEINNGYGPMADAFFFTEQTFKMHREWYNVEAYEPKPLPIGVHFDKGLDNGFFTGSAILFGDGDKYGYPLSTSINFVAHEVGHGFTNGNSGLIYKEQSGGMNEAFSDMAGETAEYFLDNKVDWVFSRACCKYATAFRFYMDPPKDGKSIGHAKDFRKGMDVHFSSGVYNKAFYILSNKPGWNIKDAYHIMLTANRMYWPRNATFCTGLKGILKATEDLGFNEADVKDSFKMVGVTTDC